MTRQLSLYAILLMFFTAGSAAQEVVTGLYSNRAVSANKKTFPFAAKGLAADTLDLPFFDDFSGRSVFPDANRWSDDHVFINNTYSDSQITMGIATLDALDTSGHLYETASSAGFMADQLTSQPVDLNYPASAGIWFSFLYQPGGLSDTPEPDDSLTLQFYAPVEMKWYSVWQSPEVMSKGFRNVIIPVNNPRFLQKGFRFRFTNYATLSRDMNDPAMLGNCDLWNLDYIKLDAGRNENDTIYADVAFRLPLRSILKNYEAMPWKQFRQGELQEMGSSITVNYRNNDDIERNVTRDFEIWNIHEGYQAEAFTAGARNIAPFTSEDYSASLRYTFSSSEPDSALFSVTCILKTDEFDPKQNDTLVYYQVFNKYFAYDDGSAEGGYGVNGLGSRNAMVAYRFTSYMPDTIRAVGICFNDSYMDANKRAFDLMIWDDNNGIPGNILFTKEELMVENGSTMNGFINYMIPDGVSVEEVFYVGWRQRSETFLNAGFDINTPHDGRQFFWLNGSWNQSQTSGSVMIRPFTANPFNMTGINDHPSDVKNATVIWPNPANDHIYLRLDDSYYRGSASISIYTITGQEIMEIPFSEYIDVSHLKKGIYVVVTNVNGMRAGYSRLIISR